MFEPLRDDTQCQGLDAGNRFSAVFAVAHNPAEHRHFCGPTSVVFAFQFYGECHDLNVAIEASCLTRWRPTPLLASLREYKSHQMQRELRITISERLDQTATTGVS